MDLIEKFSSFYTDLETMKPEELSSIYSTDVEFIDPIGKHVGIKSVEDYFNRLLDKAEQCRFIIHNKCSSRDNEYTVTWTMIYSSPSMNGGKPMEVEGVTLLSISENKIVRHRDYFDLGQMVYENVPVLGRIIKRIKRVMAQ